MISVVDDWNIVTDFVGTSDAFRETLFTDMTVVAVLGNAGVLRGYGTIMRPLHISFAPRRSTTQVLPRAFLTNAEGLRAVRSVHTGKWILGVRSS